MIGSLSMILQTIAMTIEVTCENLYQCATQNSHYGPSTKFATDNCNDYGTDFLGISTSAQHEILISGSRSRETLNILKLLNSLCSLLCLASILRIYW